MLRLSVGINGGREGLRPSVPAPVSWTVRREVVRSAPDDLPGLPVVYRGGREGEVPREGGVDGGDGDLVFFLPCGWLLTLSLYWCSCQVNFLSFYWFNLSKEIRRRWLASFDHIFRCNS